MSMVKSDIGQMSNAYVDPWDMLNNFCFHVYAQKSVFIMFIGENGNVFFFTTAQLQQQVWPDDLYDSLVTP